LYLRQRVLWNRARSGGLDALEAEEGVIAIVASVLRFAYARTGTTPARRSAARHAELADATRAELLRTVTENRSVHDIAAAVDASPYHLCRVFKATTGRTMHAYRTELRLRLALERIASSRDRLPSLSTVACDLGFASHSHFVNLMRRHAQMTPSAARALLAAS
jgi:AraC-like DNA-binding protein